MSSENLYLINGAAASDNFCAYFLPLYIEDAIQETTTSLSGVSAEYGRFTGGVVSALTKSGGNEFHGSLRLNLTNPKWTAPTPLTIERTDTIDQLWEATLGGYVLKDKLWFFLGGRTATQTTSLQTYAPVSIPYDQTDRQDRYEGKLTFALSPNHRLIGSYLDVEDDARQLRDIRVYDLDSLYTSRPREASRCSTTHGVLSNTLFLEAQYSARQKAYKDMGSRYTDIERGTPVVDMLNNWVSYNSPLVLRGLPRPRDQRDNTDAFAKASLFLSTANGRLARPALRRGPLTTTCGSATTGRAAAGTGSTPARSTSSAPGRARSTTRSSSPASSFIEYDPIFEMSKGTHFKTQVGVRQRRLAAQHPLHLQHRRALRQERRHRRLGHQGGEGLEVEPAPVAHLGPEGRRRHPGHPRLRRVRGRRSKLERRTAQATGGQPA